MDNKMTAEQAIQSCIGRLERSIANALSMGDVRDAEFDARILEGLRAALSAPRVPEELRGLLQDLIDYAQSGKVAEPWMVEKLMAVLAAYPEPVAPDAQQVIADLRAEVEALKAKAPLPITGYAVISEDEDVIEVDGGEWDALSMLAIAEEEEPNKAWSIVATIDAARLREGGA